MIKGVIYIILIHIWIDNIQTIYFVVTFDESKWCVVFPSNLSLNRMYKLLLCLSAVNYRLNAIIDSMLFSFFFHEIKEILIKLLCHDSTINYKWNYIQCYSTLSTKWIQMRYNSMHFFVEIEVHQGIFIWMVSKIIVKSTEKTKFQTELPFFFSLGLF